MSEEPKEGNNETEDVSDRPESHTGGNSYDYAGSLTSAF